MPINFGQEPDSNTDNTDNQATPAPAATPGVAPTAPPAGINPNAVLMQQAQQARPVANSPQATPAQKTQQLHTSIFSNILGTLSGGGNRPVIGSNGQPVTDANGNVVMAPASKKTLGASILAGALSAMVAGYAAPTSRTELGGGRSVQDFGPSAAAGAQASQKFMQAGSQAEAQGQADANTGRMYATVDHNLKLHAAQLNNLKLQGDLLQQGVDTDAPIIEGLAQAQPITDPNDPSKTIDPIQAQNVTETQLQKMMADNTTHVTRDSVLRDGVANVYDDDGKQVFNPDGTPRQENTFTVYNHNALVAMTDEMKGLSPNLKDVAAGTPVPVAVLAKYSRDKAVQAAATAGLQNQLKMYDETNGTKTTFSLQSALNQSPIIKTILPQIGKYGSDPIDLMFKDLRNDKTVSPTALGALQNAMGVTAEGLQKMADKRLADQNAAKKGDEASPVPAGQVGSFSADIRTAYPNLTGGQVNLLTKSLGTTPTKGEYQKIQNEAQKYSDNNTKLAAAQASKDDAAIAKGAKPVVGIDASGRQVLVPAGDVPKYGLSQVREVGQAENEKVTNARSLMTVFSNDDPDDKGLIQLARQLKDEGKLGPVASRLQDWLNKGGSVLTFDTAGDPDVQRLFTKLGLSTTGLMQVHVGARGSGQMLEHFEDLAKAKSMSPDAFLAALDTENKYVQMKAMLPNVKTKQPQTQPPAPKVVPAGKVPAIVNGVTVGYADDKQGTNYRSF